MIARRIVAAAVVIGVALASVALLPYAGKSSPVGISMTLPNVVGMWFGDDAEVTPHEIEVLAKDTQFARKLYTSPSGDQIFVSIVLSGDDMTTSIHRPERCLPAQGWTLSSSDTRTIPLPNDGNMQMTRLHSARVVQNKAHQQLTVQNLNYYWFVGYHQMTASHLARTGMDLRDRILHGYNQRWAYVTVAANITAGLIPGGRSEEQTAGIIEDFIRELIPKLRTPEGTPLVLESHSR